MILPAAAADAALSSPYMPKNQPPKSPQQKKQSYCKKYRTLAPRQTQRHYNEYTSRFSNTERVWTFKPRERSTRARSKFISERSVIYIHQLYVPTRGKIEIALTKSLDNYYNTVNTTTLKKTPPHHNVQKLQQQYVAVVEGVLSVHDLAYRKVRLRSPAHPCISRTQAL